MDKTKHRKHFSCNPVTPSSHASFSHDILSRSWLANFLGERRAPSYLPVKLPAHSLSHTHHAFTLQQLGLHQVSLHSRALSSLGGGMSNPTCIRKRYERHIHISAGFTIMPAASSPLEQVAGATNISQNIALIFHEDWNNSFQAYN